MFSKKLPDSTLLKMIQFWIILPNSSASRSEYTQWAAFLEVHEIARLPAALPPGWSKWGLGQSFIEGSIPPVVGQDMLKARPGHTYAAFCTLACIVSRLLLRMQLSILTFSLYCHRYSGSKLILGWVGKNVITLSKEKPEIKAQNMLGCPICLCACSQCHPQYPCHFLPVFF